LPVIDDINRRLISALKTDGRYSNAELARQLGLNVATVSRRIQKMLRDDVINITAVLNPYKLGYNAHALIALNVELAKVDAICGEVISSHNTSLVVTTFGRYDIMLLADFPSWEELQDFVGRQLPRIEGVVKLDTFPVVENKKTDNPLFKFESGSGKAASIDAGDRDIIETLEKDGRASFSDVAKRLGMSLATVSRRVARLKEEEIIKILAVRNPSKMGYMANAYALIHAELNKVDDICRQLATLNSVHLIMTLMSGFELVVGIHQVSSEALYKFILDKVATIDGVLNTETLVCGEIRKRSYPLFYLDNEL